MLEATTEAGPDLEAILAMSEEDLMAMDPQTAQQIAEIQQAAKQEAQQEEARRLARVQGIGQRIVGTYYERVAMRYELEQRWLRDIRRYNGQYDPEVLQALQNRKYGSQMYVPLTRRVVNIVEARLTDLLFPTEDRNFAVDPRPVPTLIRAEALASKLHPQAMVPAGPDGQPLQASHIMLGIRELREEARARADNMEREIESQLRDANYPAEARRAIHEAMVIGTGVLKGPMVLNRIKRVWEDGQLKREEDLSPTVVQVSAWDFFPDMSARTLKESESEIERHYKTKSEMARLAQQPGFDAEAIRELLRVEPSHMRDPNRDEMRRPTGTQGVKDPRYLLLEYHGPLEQDELRDMGVPVPDDNLLCYEGVLWVAEDGRVLKAILNPMDTEDRPYSVFCWEKDPGSIFGFGLSYELADLAETSNSSFRAALDNLGLSVGGQIVVNDKLIRPDNGVWAIEPNKVWRMIKADGDARSAFAFFQIDTHLQELLGVFDRSKQMIEEIGGPAMAMQGQDAPSYLNTARGASISFNAANIWMRRAVRNWDDDATCSLVGRFIDWNMQYSPKEDIKGDLIPTARGTSALLEAEGQMTKMQAFMASAAGIPMPFKRKVEQLRAMARAMRLDASEILPTDEEVKQMAEKIDNAPPPVDPASERIKLRQAEIADNLEARKHDQAMEQMRAQVNLANIASREKISIDAARAKYGLEWTKTQAEIADRQQGRAHEAQMLNAELATRVQTGAGV